MDRGGESILIHLPALPLDQHVEQRHGESQASLKVVRHAMHHLFEMADQGQHRIHRLDKHARVPVVAAAHFQIERITGFGMKAEISKEALLQKLCRRARITSSGRSIRGQLWILYSGGGTLRPK